MEWIQGIWSQIDGIVVAILAILGGFSVLAKLTPTEVDDRFIQKIIDVINALGLTKKK